MALGGKRQGAGRKPDITKQKAAEAYSKVLFEYIEKEAKPIAQALIDKAKAGDIPAVKEIHDRLMGKPEQPIVGKDGKDFFPTPLLTPLDVSSNNSNKEGGGSTEANTSSTGGNVSQQDNIDSLLSD